MTRNYDPCDYCAMCGEAWDNCAERAGDFCRDCLEAYEDEVAGDVERPPIDERYAMTCSEIGAELGEKKRTVENRIATALVRFEAKFKQLYGVQAWNEWREALRG